MTTPAPMAALREALALLDQQPFDPGPWRERVIAEVDNGFTRGERARPAFFGRRPDFAEHMNELRSEFIGRSELLFVHAALVVALRRRLAPARHLAAFTALWTHHGDLLARELSLRWLVSACDSFADHAADPARQALALLGSVLVNAVKLHESERHILGLRDADLPVVRHPGGILFDGLTCYSVMNGDMIRNMESRIRRLAAGDAVVGPILLAMLDRLAQGPTVFHRMAKRREAASADPAGHPKLAGRAPAKG
jgi:hypothetical protein